MPWSSFGNVLYFSARRHWLRWFCSDCFDATCPVQVVPKMDTKVFCCVCCMVWWAVVHGCSYECCIFFLLSCLLMMWRTWHISGLNFMSQSRLHICKALGSCWRCQEPWVSSSELIFLYNMQSPANIRTQQSGRSFMKIKKSIDEFFR